MQDINRFASGFLFCLGIAGGVSCGIGRHPRSRIFGISERAKFGYGFVRPCCLLLLLYGAKDVCFLEMWEAPYFDDRFVAVER